MKILAFSDLHRDVPATERLVAQSVKADILIGAGDFAICRQGVEDCIDVLAETHRPVVLVAGNGESFEELSVACQGKANLHVLHGTGMEIEGVAIYGIGGGIPVTPFGDWSWDFDESSAADLLSDCPENGILISHSPPFGTADVNSSGQHCGSVSVQRAISEKRPQLVVCGHIHDCWETRVTMGETLVVNAGPRGVWIEI